MTVPTSQEREPVLVADAHTESFVDFYRRLYRPVVSLTYTLSGSRTAAEELAQDAFVKAHRGWAELGAHNNCDAWVKRVAINLARSWLRTRLVEAKVLTRMRREPIRVEQMPESADQLWEAVRRLPDNQAAAIALRYHDDRSIADIAEIIGCSASTVHVHLHRGRQTLAKKLGLQFEEEQQSEA